MILEVLAELIPTPPDDEREVWEGSSERSVIIAESTWEDMVEVLKRRVRGRSREMVWCMRLE